MRRWDVCKHATSALSSLCNIALFGELAVGGREHVRNGRKPCAGKMIRGCPNRDRTVADQAKARLKIASRGRKLERLCPQGTRKCSATDECTSWLREVQSRTRLMGFLHYSKHLLTLDCECGAASPPPFLLTHVAADLDRCSGMLRLHQVA